MHAHHKTHWADGGPTDLDNLILLCGYHHRFLHEHGWTIEDDGYGKPVFRKPDGRSTHRPDPDSTPDSENSSDNEPRGNRPDHRPAKAPNYPRWMEFVDVTREESVALVTLNRPPVNAMTEDFARELGDAFSECADPTIRAVVVTGQPHFAAGADIKGFQASFDAGVEERSAWTLQEAIGILESLEKPTIAAVHGYALGGGLELAMGADFRFLADDARVGQPEILLGLIPGAGGTQRLARIVGYQRAKEMVLSGRQVDSEEALQIGLADQVFPSAELLDATLEAAREWATKATRAVAAAKKALNAGFGLPVSEGLFIERDAFNESFGSEDAREGVAAFIAKREADFKGR